MRAPTAPRLATASATTVASVVAAHLTVDVLGGGMGALLPSTADRLGLPDTAVGALVALFSLAALASQPVMGALADRFAPAKVAALTCTVAAIILSFIATASNVTALVAAIVVGGLASAAFHPAGAVVARAAAPTRAEAAIAAFSAGGTAGLAIGPVAAIAVVGSAGSGPAWLLAVPAALVAVAVWTTGRRLPTPTRRARRAPLRSLASGRLSVLAGAATLVAVTSTAIAGVVPLWIADTPGRSSTDPAIGWALATFSLAAAVGGVLGGVLPARVDVATVLPGSLLASIAPIVGLIAATPGSLAAFVALAAIGVLIGPVIPVLLVAAQDETPDRAAAASGSIMGLSYGLAGVAFFAVAMMVDLAGHRPAIGVAALALVPGSLLVRRALAGSAPVNGTTAELVCRCVTVPQVSPRLELQRPAARSHTGRRTAVRGAGPVRPHADAAVADPIRIPRAKSAKTSSPA